MGEILVEEMSDRGLSMWEMASCQVFCIQDLSNILLFSASVTFSF